MSVVSAQSGITARANKPFTFTRKRGNDAEDFFPAAGARLRFASCDTDTLTLPGLPVGLLGKDDVVTVSYKGTQVFRGTVATRVERQGRGTDRVEDVTVEGPWGLMARLVFRQEWKVSSTVSQSCSHLILNQAPDGTLQDMTAQVQEIAEYASDNGCGFSYSENNIDAGTTQLPPDEARDITCAAAIMRTLRFFPQTVCRFDYSTTSPALHVSIPPENPSTADYLDPEVVPETQRSYTRTSHPVVGVDIATEGFDLVTGNNSVDSTLRKFTHQTIGVQNSIDTLHIFMPLAKGSSSTSWEKLEVETLPGDTYTNLNFWIQNHPALAGFSTTGTNKVEFANPGQRNIFPESLPITNGRLTDTTVGDLKRFGFLAEVVRMTATVKITTPDKEETLALTLDWVCTNATTRTYTRQTGSSSTAGETLPAGLAAAILAQRGGDLMSEEVTIRLGDSFPTLGDADVVTENNVSQVLYLQSFEVDCYDLTAQLHFGRPAFLSPEDMRDLLLGFRQRGFASNVPNRGEPDADDNMDDAGGVQPLKSSSIVVSSIEKSTVKGSGNAGNKITLDTTSGKAIIKVKTGSGNSGKSISLDISDIPSECDGALKVHEFSFLDKNGDTQVYHGIFCSDINLEKELGKTVDEVVNDTDGSGNPVIVVRYTDGTEDVCNLPTSGSGTPSGGGSGSTTTEDVITGISFGFDPSSHQLTAALTKKRLTVVAKETISDGTANLPLWEHNVVVSSAYNSDKDHKFKNKVTGGVVTHASVDTTTSSDADVFTSTAHSEE